LRAGPRGAVTERIVEAPEVVARSEGWILEEYDATVRGVEEELGRRLAERFPQDESDFGVRRGQEKRGRAVVQSERPVHEIRGGERSERPVRRDRPRHPSGAYGLIDAEDDAGGADGRGPGGQRHRE